MTDNNSPRNARLRIRDITKSYDSAPVLTGVSLTIEPGETIAAVGPSGFGKLTLLHCTSSVLLPDGGDVIFGDTKINSLSDADRSVPHLHGFGFAFQDGRLLPEPTAKENVALLVILQGKKRSKPLELVDDTLNRLGLTDLTRRRPGQMSDGRAQRVAIACTMAGESGVVFTDGPAGALDQSTGHEIMQQLIASVEQTDTTLVMVIRGVKVVNWCHRRVETRDGLIRGDRMLVGAEVTR